MHVLLIQADPAEARRTMDRLRRAEGGPFTLVHAADLDQALGALSASGFDAALLDLDLPGTSGVGAVERVMARAPGLPLVVLTGPGDAGAGREALRRGALELLKKAEAGPEDLARALRYARERRESAARLLGSQADYRAIFDAMNEAILVHDADSLEIVDANRAACELFGRGLDELRGARIEDLASGEPGGPREPIGELMRRAAAGDPVELEWGARARGGETFWLEVSLKTATIGGRTRLLAVMRDVTARRTLEAQLVQAQRLEAVGRLAGGLAHDFNNLLQVVLGQGEILIGGLAPGDPLRAGVERMMEAADRAAGLTRQLLAFSRNQILEPRALNLNTVVRDMEGMLRRLIGEGISMELRLDPDLGCTLADPAQIEQVIMNLAVNARDAMPDGGTLVIETANVNLDEDYANRHAQVKAGPYVRLAVGDTGSGMDEQTLERIFEPFFTTKERGKGTGLGLATVYGIVKQSGGFIWAYSEPGRGSSFKIYLPRTFGAEEEPRRPAIGDRPLGSGETVLLVEDEDSVRATVRQGLEACGYSVLEARSPGEALLMAERHPAALDLVLTDVVMPMMGGRELVERLRRVRPDIAVLFMSGYTDNIIAHHGVLERGVAFLQKPFTRNVLARKVREALLAARQPTG